MANHEGRPNTAAASPRRGRLQTTRCAAQKSAISRKDSDALVRGVRSSLASETVRPLNDVVSERSEPSVERWSSATRLRAPGTGVGGTPEIRKDAEQSSRNRSLASGRD